jgi:predicted nuclease of predicted toxin-antitoxin system
MLRVARNQRLCPSVDRKIQNHSSVNLLQASDVEVWEYAKLFALCTVTADADFYELSTTMGAPPKVVWLKGCDYPTSVAAQLIRDQAIRITEFPEDSERAVLILRP